MQDQTIIKLKEVNSTNEFAMDLLRTGKAENFTLIISENQISGKGQKGNKWLSEAGKNFTGSLICYPNLKPERIFYLNMITSLAVCDTIKSFADVRVEIKWPNDILFNKEKIAGILIENQIKGNALAASVIGVGMNINQVEFDESLNATSLHVIGEKTFPLEEITTVFLNQFRIYFDQLNQGFFAVIEKNYLKHLYGLNQSLRFEDSSGVFQGQIQGISEDGRLIILKENEKKKYDLKEVKFIF